MNNNYFLKTQPIGTLLIKLSLPMMFSMLVNSIYNIVDSVYVSRLGTEAISSLSLIFPLQNLTVAVSVGLGIGINSVISRLMGAQKQEEAEKAIGTGFVLATINAIIFFFVGLFLTSPYVGIYTSSNSLTYKYAVEYGQIVLCFSFPYLMYLVFEKLYQSLGWMKIAMTGMLIGAITNILLDPIFIFGYFGLPKLDVAGAAIATIAGQTLGFLAFLLIYKFGNFPIRIYWKNFKINKELSKNIYTVGIPAAATLVLPSVLVGVLNGILAAFSEISIAVLGLYYRVQTFFYMPLSGLCQGLRPIISYNYGAKEYKRVRTAFYYSVIIGVILLGIGFLIMQFFPETVMRLFDAKGELLEQGKIALRIISIGFIPSVIPIISCGVFEALGLGMQSLIISVLRQIIILIPVAYILSIWFLVTGVWCAFPIAETAAAIISYILIKIYFRKLRI